MGTSASSPEPIHVVGIGLDGAAGLAPASRQQVNAATVLVGSDRHLSYFPQHPAARLSLNHFLERLQAGALDADLSSLPASPAVDESARIVVLASGDPLFFGVGRLLLQYLPPERLVFHPHISAIQMAFSRVKLPWQDADIVSVHGRSPEVLLSALRRGAAKLAVLTDGVTTPAGLAQLLLDLGLGDRYHIWVCESLGSKQERVRSYQAADLAQETESDPLNVLILQRHSPQSLPDAPLIGIDDEQFASFPDRPGLMTKKPVRLLVLGQLQLRNRLVIWDIGAGTGSVSIEAARLCPASRVYAIEKRAAGIALIQNNMSRFDVTTITPVSGRAPECLAHLPDPHRIFIGGSDGDLASILDVAQVRLQSGGVLVAALATLESIAIATQWLQNRPPEVSRRWYHQFSQVQVACSVPVGALTRLTPSNPVMLLTLGHR